MLLHELEASILSNNSSNFYKAQCHLNKLFFYPEFIYHFQCIKGMHMINHNEIPQQILFYQFSFYFIILYIDLKNFYIWARTFLFFNLLNFHSLFHNLFLLIFYIHIFPIQNQILFCIIHHIYYINNNNDLQDLSFLKVLE